VTVPAGAHIADGWGARSAARARLRSPVRRLLSLAGLSRSQAAGRVAFLGVVLAVSIISLISVVNALTWVNRPFAGFLVNPRMVIGTVGQYQWTGPAAGVRNPDRILTANDRKVSTIGDLEAAVREAPVGAPVRYELERGGRAVQAIVPTMRFSWGDLLMTFGITFASGLTYLLLAVIVFLLKPDAEASVAFLLACFVLSVFTIVSFDVFSTHRAFTRLYLLADTVLPAAFLHLALVFPERRRVIERHPTLLLAPYLVSLALAIPYQLLYPRPPFEIFAKASRLYAVVAAVALIASPLLVILGRASQLARQRAKVVLLGAALAFPITGVVRYSALVGGSFLGLTIQTNLLALPLILFPASIAYAIARHNLFDVDVYIKRAVGYGIMTVLVGMTYLSTQAVMNQVILAMFGEGGERIAPILFALSVVLLFNPVNRRVQATVDRVFFRKTLDYKQTVSAVSDALASMLNLDQIVQQVIRTVRQEMFVDTAALIVLEPGLQAYRTFYVDETKAAAAAPPRAPVAYDDPLLALMREEKTLITRYDVDEDPRYADARDACLTSFSTLAASLAIPLIYHGEVKGILALGEKKSGAFYAREDVDLLTTMANQTAVAIQNADTHEEVVRYAAELAASLRRIQILESIKTNLAKFVPKTVQNLIEESPEAPSLDKREADLSVVFADITGYTRLSAQLELDQVNRLVERYFGAFLDEIVRYGGDVNETAGDGLMVIFRDPDPDRHAHAAVLAALGIQRRTREINGELIGQFEPIAMHVGVNSGIASVGATKIEGAAGTRWTYTASGPTTNIAARLAALGEGGAVVMSAETRRRLGPEFDVEDMGPQSLKNVAQPVQVYRLAVEEVEPAAAAVFDERRRHARRPVSWPVRLWIGEDAFHGRVVDASVYGICVATVPMALLDMGKSYRLDVTLAGGGELRCVAEVRNLGDRGIGMETKEPLPAG
jgi:class 3 adenylate cyclase